MEEIELLVYQRKVSIIAAVVIFALLIITIVLGVSLIKAPVIPSKVEIQKQQEQLPLRREGMYPDPQLTPGDVFLGVTKDVICVSGYTKTVRDVPLSLRKKVFADYKIVYPPPTGMYELDHFIPLAIGGSNDAKNLWPESEEPRPGFREKDIVEVYLLDQVCHHNLDLEKAQESVRIDWYAVYESIPNRAEFIW